MARTHRHATVFRRGSNVLEYWLVHAEGFEVAGAAGTRERVERVVVDPVDGRASELVVRSPLRRRRMLPARAVAAVDPFAGRLHLEREPRPARPARVRPHAAQLHAGLSRLQPHAAQAARVASRVLAAVSLTAARWLLTALAWLLPRTRRAAYAAVTWLLPRVRRAAHAAATWLRPRLRTAAVAAAAAAVAASRAGLRLALRLARVAAGRARRSWPAYAAACGSGLRAVGRRQQLTPQPRRRA